MGPNGAFFDANGNRVWPNFKTDFQLRDRRYGLDEVPINFGIGWLFWARARAT